MPVGDSNSVAGQDRTESGSAPNASSNTTNTAEETTGVTVDPPPAYQVAQEPDAGLVIPVMQYLARVVRGTLTTSSFENPFKDISKLFTKIFDMLSFDNNQISNRHKGFVKELFGELADKLEHDHHEDDDSVEHLLES